MNPNFEKLKPYLDKQYALMHALALMEWDSATEAPKACAGNRAIAMEILSNEYYAAANNEEIVCLLEKLKDAKDLTEDQKGIVAQQRRTYDNIRPIPQKEYAAFKALTSRAARIWEEAKEHQDFSRFAPTLAQIIDTQKRFAAYLAKDRGYEGPLYDMLLDQYEPGFDTKTLDNFFDKLKTALLPLVRMAVEKNPHLDKSYNSRSYPIKLQRQISKKLADHIGFDFNRGVMKESVHPFTINFHNKDVRITTAYHENNLESAMFSTIHEGGHALYEMHIDDALTMTPAGTGTSMGFHESQSRLFENNIGRSRAFWEPLWDMLKNTYPDQLFDISLDDFILGINKAEPSLVRTEADELTYCLHIIVRYEIEKMIINKNIDINDLPKIWNDKYEAYLGVRPSNDSEGILQDVHWSGGDFGYFPSYAIGSAIAAQIYGHLQTAIDIDACLRKGDFKTINDYLKDKLHRFGATKNSNELLMNLMGEEFNPDYFINYLTKKYTALYQRL